jgi:competence protein ComEC
MWREKFLFILTLVFIGGNLLSRAILSHLTPLHIGTFSICFTLLTATLIALILLRKGEKLPLFVPLFLVLGGLNCSLASLLGEYSFLQELAASEPISELRQIFSQRLARVIPPSSISENSLLEALSMGEKGGIPFELKRSYRLSGAMHLLALSGLHVGFIYGFLRHILGFLPTAARGCTTIGFLLFYTIFSGASPSICRAVLMASIYETGTMLGREKHGLNSLSVSALIICCTDPHAPSSISFQLSYSAMLGIFLIHPVLNRIISGVSTRKGIRKIWELTALSISCQLFTAPLTLYHFGSFPLVSLLTNILTMPVISAVMTLIPIAVVLADIPLAGGWTSTLLNISIQTLNLLVEIISTILE